MQYKQAYGHHSDKKAIIKGMPGWMKEAATECAVRLENRALPLPKGKKYQYLKECRSTIEKQDK